LEERESRKKTAKMANSVEQIELRPSESDINLDFSKMSILKKQNKLQLHITAFCTRKLYTENPK